MRMRGREGGATIVRQEMMARQPAGVTRHREAARRDDETMRDVFFKTFSMTITQHTSIHNFHASDLFFEEIMFHNFYQCHP
jgi:hypothetical protein